MLGHKPEIRTRTLSQNTNRTVALKFDPWGQHGKTLSASGDQNPLARKGDVRRKA